MTKREIESVAERITEYLFQFGGTRKRVSRLVMEMDNKLDGPGWGRKPLKDVIKRELEDQPKG
jgi:hypothetical protein